MVVELWRNVGGMIQRALIGADFTADQAQTLTVLVGTSGTYELDRPKTCASASAPALPLVAGLPDDYGPPVMESLTTGAAQLPSGTLVIDRAGYDDLGSSDWAFHVATTLLVVALSTRLRGGDLETMVQSTMALIG